MRAVGTPLIALRQAGGHVARTLLLGTRMAVPRTANTLTVPVLLTATALLPVHPLAGTVLSSPVVPTPVQGLPVAPHALRLVAS